MINKVILMGRLTRDPELRYTNSQTPVCSFCMAVDNGYGENRKTDFINCVAWNKTAEFVSKYFSKGRMMIVIGRIATRTWEGNDGKKNYTTEVVASEVSFGESKKDESESGEDSGQGAPDIPQDGFVPLIDADDDLPF